MMPFILMLLVYTVGCAMSLACFVLARFTALVEFKLDLHLRCAVAIALFCYTAIAETAFSALNCVDVGTQSVLYAYPAISCAAGDYKAALSVLCLVLIFFTLGLPALLLFTSWRLHAFPTLPLKFKTRWGLVHEPYKEEAFYYEAVVLLRRALYSALDIGLALVPGVQRTMISVCALACLVLHVHTLPFKRAVLNTAETASLILHMLLAIVVAPWAAPYPVALEAVICIFIVVPTLFFVGWLLRLYMAGKKEAAKKAEKEAEQERKRNAEGPTVMTIVKNSEGKEFVAGPGRFHLRNMASLTFSPEDVAAIMASGQESGKPDTSPYDDSEEPDADAVLIVKNSEGKEFVAGPGRFHVRNKASVALSPEEAAAMLASEQSGGSPEHLCIENPAALLDAASDAASNGTYLQASSDDTSKAYVVAAVPNAHFSLRSTDDEDAGGSVNPPHGAKYSVIDNGRVAADMPSSPASPTGAPTQQRDSRQLVSSILAGDLRTGAAYSASQPSSIAAAALAAGLTSSKSAAAAAAAASASESSIRAPAPLAAPPALGVQRDPQTLVMGLVAGHRRATKTPHVERLPLGALRSAAPPPPPSQPPPPLPYAPSATPVPRRRSDKDDSGAANFSQMPGQLADPEEGSAATNPTDVNMFL
jgi:hypothetical protein